MAELEGWGERIYEARTAGMRRKRGRQMSQEELARAAGVSAPQVGFYESETNWPGWSKWMAMAVALDVTVGWLIAGEQPMERRHEHGPPGRQRPGKQIKRPAPRSSGKGNDEPQQKRG